MADPTAYGREGIFLLDEFEGLTVFASRHQGNVTLHTDVGGTPRLAGSDTPFRDRKGARNGLSIFFKGGLSQGQPLIVFIRPRYRTYLCAVTTCGAAGGINVTRPFSNRYVKIAFRAFNRFYLGTGDQVDVRVPADLDQFGRDNSHGAIVGGEGLVQFAHHTAYGG